MDRRGVTIIETLAVIVMTGITTILLINLVIFINKIQDSSSTEREIGMDSKLVETRIKSLLDQMDPTSVDYCTIDGSTEEHCLSFLKEYEYYFDEENNTIQMNEFNPPNTLTFHVLNGTLYVDSIAFEITNSELLDLTTFYINPTNNDVEFYIVLNSTEGTRDERFFSYDMPYE